MSGSWTQSLLKQLRDKRFRSAYVAEDIRTGIAFQIRALRESRGWSQAELGRRADKPQSVIARLEDPDYGRLSLRTLLDMASAFDIALLVRFVSFGELLRRNTNLSQEALAVPEFSNDRSLGAGSNAVPSTAAVGGDVIAFPGGTVNTGSISEGPAQQQGTRAGGSEFATLSISSDYKRACGE
jgi:transcriptional regulator with XRE-family HTH domain